MAWKLPQAPSLLVFLSRLPQMIQWDKEVKSQYILSSSSCGQSWCFIIATVIPAKTEFGPRIIGLAVVATELTMLFV